MEPDVLEDEEGLLPNPLFQPDRNRRNFREKRGGFVSLDNTALGVQDQHIKQISRRKRTYLLGPFRSQIDCVSCEGISNLLRDLRGSVRCMYLHGMRFGINNSRLRKKVLGSSRGMQQANVFAADKVKESEYPRRSLQLQTHNCRRPATLRVVVHPESHLAKTKERCELICLIH